MKRILADRGLGKTSNLFGYAVFLAEKYSDEYILYVTSSPALTKTSLRQKEIPNNILFVSYERFNEIKGPYKAVIDELDLYLRNVGVMGYTMTLSDKGVFDENN